MTTTALSSGQALGQKGVLTHGRKSPILRARRVLLFLPELGFCAQLLIDQSSVAILCAFLAALGSFLIIFDAFRVQRLYRYPLSTWMVLGFGITLQLGPLLFTAVEGNSIIFNLEVPVATFSHGLAISCLVVLGHRVYRSSRILSWLRSRVQLLFLQIGLFRPLRLREVLAMGGLGVFALAFTSWFSGWSDTRLLTKFIQGFQFFSILPAAFVLQGLVRPGLLKTAPDLSQRRGRILVFVGFLLAIIVVAVGRNARAPFVIPAATLVLGLALEWLYGLIRIRLGTLVAFLLSILIILPVVSDLATAMVMVRGQRGDVPPIELLQLTISQFQDRQAVQNYRDTMLQLVGADWSETYVGNLFLARFANAKYPDNSLENASRVPPESAAEADFREFQLNRLLATFPTPVLSLFGMSEAAKDAVGSFSFGDKLYSLVSGVGLGGFRTGHFFGTGLVGFGYLYFLVFFGITLLIFPLFDAHSQFARSPGMGLVAPRFSVVFITQLVGWLIFSNAESVVSYIAFPLRGFIEPIVLFVFARSILSRLRFA